mmetsp:Transcript_53257/g.84941  ORF Transcript_53257/g.84941 Transcript_53257/m.84941 type:complete len:233 (+) Transcript_53257:481-1179(+)
MRTVSTSLVVWVAMARAASMIFGSPRIWLAAGARQFLRHPGVDATPLVWSGCQGVSKKEAFAFLLAMMVLLTMTFGLGMLKEQIGSWCASHITEKAATTSLSTEHLGHLDTLFRQLLMPVAASESMAASWRRRGWKVFSAEMRGNFHLQRLRQMTGGKSEVGMRGSMCAPSLQSGFNQVRRHGLHEPDMWRWWIQKVTLSSSSAERDLQASWQTCGRRLSALTWSICTTCWS